MSRSLRDISLRPLFHPDAYEFLKVALRFTLHHTPRLANSSRQQQAPVEPGVPDESQHVTGQELLEGIRRYALEQYGLMTVMIFDRWGELVFETSEQGVGWDGYYKDKLLKPAVFIYVLEVTTLDGEEVVKKGDITLVR